MSHLVAIPTLVMGILLLVLLTSPVTVAPDERVGESAASEARPAFKLMVLLHKHDEMSADEFERYFMDVHLPYVLAIPHLRGYTVNFAAGDAAPRPYDAISEFWFEDAAAFEAAMASPEVAATLADAENMLRPDGLQMFFASERVVRAIE